MTTETIFNDDQMKRLIVQADTNDQQKLFRFIENAVLQSDKIKQALQDSQKLASVMFAIEELDQNGSLPFSLEGFLP